MIAIGWNSRIRNPYFIFRSVAVPDKLSFESLRSHSSESGETVSSPHLLRDTAQLFNNKSIISLIF